MEAFFKGLESIAIALSFVVAAAAYVADRRKNAADIAAKRLQRWQSGVVQRLMQQRKSEPVSFEEILQRYRSESLVVPGDLKKSDLSEEALRSIIIDLQSRRVISALGNDVYRLHTIGEMAEALQSMTKDGLPFSLLNTIMPVLQSSTTMSSTEQRLFGLISGIILEEPGKYGVSDLVLKVAKQENLDNDLVRRCVTGMIARRYVIERADHKLMLGVPAIDLPANREDHDQ